MYLKVLLLLFIMKNRAVKLHKQIYHIYNKNLKHLKHLKTY